jgi:hypothetical protein
MSALRSVAEVGLSARTRERTGHCSNAGGLSAVVRDPLYRKRQTRVFPEEICSRRVYWNPADEKLPLHSAIFTRRRSHPRVVSRVSVVRARDDRQEPGCRELLALQKLR